MIRLVLALAAALIASPALAAPISISSPDGVLTVAVDVNGEAGPNIACRASAHR
jgi:hypothetical protein